MSDNAYAFLSILNNSIVRTIIKSASKTCPRCGETHLEVALDDYLSEGNGKPRCLAAKLISKAINQALNNGGKAFGITDEQLKRGLHDPYVRRGACGKTHLGVALDECLGHAEGRSHPIGILASRLVKLAIEIWGLVVFFLLVLITLVAFKVEGVWIATILVMISFSVILSLGLLARSKLREMPYSENPEIKPFWLDRLLGNQNYATFVVLGSFGSTLIDLILSSVKSLTWWWTPSSNTALELWRIILFNLAVILGLMLLRSTYQRLKEEVFPSMLEKAKITQLRSEKESILKILVMFTEVAGGSRLYQGICILLTISLYFILEIYFCLTLGRLMSPISALDVMVYVVMAGLVGPLATAISGFVVFCGLTFEDPKYFDLLAPDQRGGFETLGKLAAVSSKIAALSPGLALPILLIGYESKSQGELALSIGLIFFVSICVFLFFFVPIFFVHRSMAKSRGYLIKELEKTYREPLRQFVDKLKSKERLSERELLRLLVLNETLERMHVSTKEWPMGFSTTVKVLFLAVVPTLASITEIILFFFVILR